MKNFLPVFLTFFSFNSPAQTGLMWHFNNTGSSNGYIQQMLKFSNGDVLTRGFNQGGDLNPAAGTDTSKYEFFARYTANGNYVFGRPICYGNSNPGTISWVRMDHSDNFYICLSAQGGFYDFDSLPGVGEYTLTQGDVALVKFDPNGNFLYCIAYTGSNYNLFILNITISEDNGILLAGEVDNLTLDLDPGPGTWIFNGAGEYDGCAIKFDSSGNFVNACQIRTTSGYYPNYNSIVNVVTDSQNNIYLLAGYNGTIDVDPGTGTHLITHVNANSPYPYFLLKLDVNFNFKYVSFLSEDSYYNLFTDPFSNLYYWGYTNYYGVDIDPTAGVDSVGRDQMFMVKLDSSGNYLWGKKLPTRNNTASYLGSNISYDYFNHSFSSVLYLNDTVAENGFGLPSISDTPGSSYLLQFDTSGTAVTYIKLSSYDDLQNPLAVYSDANHFYFSGRIDHKTDIEIGPGITVDSSLLGSPWNEFFLSYYVFDAAINRIDGNAFIDDNGNYLKDTSESGLKNAIVNISPGSYYLSTDIQGNYSAYVPAGNYSIGISNSFSCLGNSFPMNHSANFPSTNQIDTANNFAFLPSGTGNDAAVYLTAYGAARPGFYFNYYITASNLACLSSSGDVTLIMDSSLTLVSSSMVPTSQIGQTIIWNYTSLLPFQSFGIDLLVQVNTGTSIGDSIYSYASINPFISDIDTSNNFSSSLKTVTGSIDPNEKSVLPAGDISVDDVQNGMYLDYTINFQNTGNDTAFMVTILDTLYSGLDPLTLQILSSSHPYHFQLYASRLMEFKFENILLADSFVNEPASHGFIRYRIKPKISLTPGDRIENKGYIYFDYNDVVVTNSTINTVMNPVKVQIPDVKNNSVRVVPNPFHESVKISFNNEKHEAVEIIIHDITGRDIFNGSTTSSDYFWKDSGIDSGIYYIEVKGIASSVVKVLKF